MHWDIVYDAGFLAALVSCQWIPAKQGLVQLNKTNPPGFVLNMIWL